MNKISNPGAEVEIVLKSEDEDGLELELSELDWVKDPVEDEEPVGDVIKVGLVVVVLKVSVVVVSVEIVKLVVLVGGEVVVVGILVVVVG